MFYYRTQILILGLPELDPQNVSEGIISRLLNGYNCIGTLGNRTVLQMII